MVRFSQIKTALQQYYQTDLIYLPLQITLIIIIGINGIAVILGLLGLKWLWDHPGSIPATPLIIFTFLSWLNTFFAGKIWKFKRWGFWGLCATSVAYTIVQLIFKANYATALSGLIVPIIVFLGLQIGGTRKGWLKM